MSTVAENVDSQAAPTPGKSKILLRVAIALFVFTRLFLLTIFQPDSSDASHNYFKYASLSVDLGQVAYKDYVIEYPPISWWAMAVPRWIDPLRLTEKSPRHELERVRARYHRLFRWEMFACDVGAFALFIAILRRRRPEVLGLFAVAYVVITTLLAHLLYDRLDPGLSLFIMGWGYCWLRAIESPKSAVWVAAAYLLVGLSISYKVVPGIIVPFLLLAHLYAPGRVRNVAIGVAMLAIGIITPFAILWPTVGSDSLKFLSFHSRRGVHLESLPGMILIVASWFGLPLEIPIPLQPWGFDVISSWSPLVKKIFSAILFGFLACAGLKAFIEWKRYTPERAYQFSLWVIVTSVILATVLSPQYFVWAMPMILLLGAEWLPAGKRQAITLTVILTFITGLSTWIYPYHYFPHDVHASLIDLDRSVCILLVIRNLLYLAVIAWLSGLLLVSKRPATAAIPAV